MMINVCNIHSLSENPLMSGAGYRGANQLGAGLASKARFILLAMVLLSTSAIAGLGEGLAAFQKSDWVIALKELQPLAENGNAKAQSKLANMYSRGHGVAINPNKAAELYAKAAEQGDAEAQSSLGFLYLMGQGIKQDSSLALKWTREAAGRGELSAQYNLGSMYGNGYGVKQDPVQAASWYRKAAEQGHADAQNNLGILYRQGMGIAKDKVLAYTLFSLSAAQVHAAAQKNRKTLQAQLSPQQIKEGRELAFSWKPGIPFPRQSKTGR